MTVPAKGREAGEENENSRRLLSYADDLHGGGGVEQADVMKISLRSDCSFSKCMSTL